MGPQIPEETKETFRQHLHSYNFWSLTGKDIWCFCNLCEWACLNSAVSNVPTGLEYVITQLKSLILSLGLIDRHLSVEQAVLLSRLEEEYQVWWFLFYSKCLMIIAWYNFLPCL